MMADENTGDRKPSAETLLRFAAIVGERYAIGAEADMAPYLTEWRDRYRGRAALILRPDSTQQVAAIMALAAQTGTAIVPQGGNTGLVGGQIPYESGHEIVLSLGRLNRVREVDAAGNTLTMEAGVTLAAAQAAAEGVERLFPLSLASEGSCQIGGNLATNAGGVQVLAYGSARDLTLGLEVVLASGEVWNGLKSLRKDNTGYDLKSLFIGSEGTLGVITAATLKLFPRPKEQTAIFAGLSSLEDIARLFEMARDDAGPGLTLFELMPRIGIEFVTKHMAGRDPLADAYPWYALIEISSPSKDGRASELSMQLMEYALEAEVVKDAVIASSLAQAVELRHLREAISEAQKFEGGSIKHDVSIPIATVPEFIARASEMIERMAPGARPVPFGHFGDGNIHFNISQPVGADKAAFLALWDEISEAVHGMVKTMGGSISAEHGVGRMKRDLLAQVKSPVEIALMRQIKAALDPLGILNPGKLL
ncbi:MAG: FAD-binding oxidoreductase [Hyphomicrobiales bacterium]|nr:FAD-binding oxidoreductase [Hyphomicrobiales bacterium]